MKRSTMIFTLTFLFSVAFCFPALAAPPATSRSDFHNDMRKLWEDHITWTRLFIVSAAADLPDKGPTTDRLLQNQVDIGNAVKPYYGDAAGEKLTALLKEHICRAWGVQQGRDFSYQSVMPRPIQLMHRMIGAIAFVKVHKSRFYLPFRLFGVNAALDPNVQLRFAYWQNLPSLCAYC